MFRTIALTGFAALLAAATIPLAPPAQAQIGNIFSDPVPRPPGNIPRGNQPPPPDDEEEVPELPQGRLLPTPNRPLPGQGAPAPGAVQSQPLAPPPGTTIIPQNTPPAIAAAPPEPNHGVPVAARPRAAVRRLRAGRRQRPDSARRKRGPARPAEAGPPPPGPEARPAQTGGPTPAAAAADPTAPPTAATAAATRRPVRDFQAVVP